MNPERVAWALEECADRFSVFARKTAIFRAFLCGEFFSQPHVLHPIVRSNPASQKSLLGLLGVPEETAPVQVGRDQLMSLETAEAIGSHVAWMARRISRRSGSHNVQGRWIGFAVGAYCPDRYWGEPSTKTGRELPNLIKLTTFSSSRQFPANVALGHMQGQHWRAGRMSIAEVDRMNNPEKALAA